MDNNEEELENWTGTQWANLLFEQPQFADKRGK